MTSVALVWSSAFDSDGETRRRGKSNRRSEQELAETYYNEKGELVCAAPGDSHPFRDLQYDFSRDRDPLPKRVNRWLRQTARSEGHHVPLEADDIPQEQFTGPVWQEWGATDDWLHGAGIECMGPFEPDPLANNSDPKLLADFHFVEKTARKRKMSEKEARRLHIVFRAPTEEKIKRIQDMIKSLSPLVLLENCRNASGSSSSFSR